MLPPIAKVRAKRLPTTKSLSSAVGAAFSTALAEEETEAADEDAEAEASSMGSDDACCCACALAACHCAPQVLFSLNNAWTSLNSFNDFSREDEL